MFNGLKIVIARNELQQTEKIPISKEESGSTPKHWQLLIDDDHRKMM